MAAESTAPLQNFRVVGVRENWYSPVPEVKQPGGSCWHCGTGIAIEVVIQSTVDPTETHVIGTTCAERVGLNGPDLKRFLAEKFAEQRAEARRTRNKAYREEQARLAAEAVAKYGEHGTEGRYLEDGHGGCRCTECVKVAPHGTWHRFLFGDCHCLDCIDAILLDPATRDDYTIHDQLVLIDLATGLPAKAKTVDTRYGWKWCVNDGAEWVPASPARRTTQTKRGYVQAWAPFLVERCGKRGRQWLKPIVRVGDAIVDYFGEPIVPGGES